MAKRYYISRRIGSGTSDDPYRCELMYWLRGQGHQDRPIKIVIAHTFPFALSKYDLADAIHTQAIAALPNLFAFPVGALDRTVGSIPAQIRNAVKNKMNAVGLDSSWVTNATLVREVLDYIAHTIQLSEWADVQIGVKNFDTRKTVADISVEKRTAVGQHLQDLGIPTGWITGTTTVSEIIRKVQQMDDGSPRLFGRSRQRRWFHHDEDTE